MKVKLPILMAFSVFAVLVGCKSEADKVVDKACNVDLENKENQKICEEALSSNCGESFHDGEEIQRDLLQLDFWKAMFAAAEISGRGEEEKKEELKKSEKDLKSKWNDLPLSSTCKESLEKLSDIERSRMKKDLVESGKNMVKEQTSGFVSSIVEKVKSFISKKPEEMKDTTKNSEEYKETSNAESSKVEDTHNDKQSVSEQSVSSEKENVIVDSRDGNEYRTTVYNGRQWMAENLKFVTEGSFCYDNNSKICEKYGRLYAWNSAMTACPEGWRLPLEAEWTEVPLSDWNVLAGYYYVAKGSFHKKGETAYYWTKTEVDSDKAVDMDLNMDAEAFIKKSHSKTDVAFSVRCVKD